MLNARGIQHLYHSLQEDQQHALPCCNQGSMPAAITARGGATDAVPRQCNRRGPIGPCHAPRARAPATGKPFDHAMAQAMPWPRPCHGPGHAMAQAMPWCRGIRPCHAPDRVCTCSHAPDQKGLSFITNRQRRKEGTFCASELAGIEPTPPAPKGAGYVRLDHSATVGPTSCHTQIMPCPMPQQHQHVPQDSSSSSRRSSSCSSKQQQQQQQYINDYQSI
jgi:hypothetical protein